MASFNDVRQANLFVDSESTNTANLFPVTLQTRTLDGKLESAFAKISEDRDKDRLDLPSGTLSSHHADRHRSPHAEQRWQAVPVSK